MSQDMHQSNNNQNTGARANGRITRGFSNLPKEEPKEPSSSSSEEAENSTPKEEVVKTKKIHHMTLKAMQRKKKLQQQREKAGINSDDEKQKEAQKPPPRRRGRPRGSKRVQKDREEYQIEDSSISQEIKEQTIKREINLRKRVDKKIVDPESNEQSIPPPPKKQQWPKEVQLPIEPVQPESIQPKKTQNPLAPAQAPKKRGRKKKVQPEPQPMQIQHQTPRTNVKIFTVPKAQTYNNYHKFYQKIIQTTQENDQPQIPLIFDRQSHPQQYQQLLSQLKQSQ